MITVNTNFFISYGKIGIGLVLFQLVYSCTFRSPDQASAALPENKYVYDGDGRLKSRITIEDGKINGEAITYYPGGQISTRVHYVDNRKDGIEKKYYKGGQLYRTRQFVMGKLNGLEKRYYKSGRKKTVQEFQNNNPASGLIEYNINETVISDYPELLFKIVKERDYAEQVLLLFYMSDSSKNVIYYSGNLIKNKYFDNLSEPELCLKGVGEIWLDPGYSGSFHIAAKVVRESRGLFITQAKVMIKNEEIIKVEY